MKDEVIVRLKLGGISEVFGCGGGEFHLLPHIKVHRMPLNALIELTVFHQTSEYGKERLSVEFSPDSARRSENAHLHCIRD